MDINRIKIVLVEKKKTAKWLAETLGKDPATVSKWCTNTTQPSIETFLEIARLLGVDLTELIVRSDVNRGIAAEPYVPYGEKWHSNNV